MGMPLRGMPTAWDKKTRNSIKKHDIDPAKATSGGHHPPPCGGAERSAARCDLRSRGRFAACGRKLQGDAPSNSPRGSWLICGSAPPLSESNVFLTELRHLYPFSPFTAEIEGSDKQNSQITWFFKKVPRVFCFVFWFEDRNFWLGLGLFIIRL